ncbi:MAG TPA: radical SAM protein [Dissulfurispiraceae bacterium]|nr:radical SAM protein [Dissulfurispiraceae bacterium]
MMRYYLANNFVLKRLETPALYDIKGDELYELDETAFEFLKKCGDYGGCSGDGADKEFLVYCISEGILSETLVSVRIPHAGFPAVPSVFPSLRYLELQITDRCNLRCRHCYIDNAEQNELSSVVIRDLLDEFELMQGLRLLITGGEPLAHSDFDSINGLLPGYGFRKILFTNGLLLDKEAMRTLNVDEIQFSVDGMERGHDALRGEGTYKKVMKSLEDAEALGMAVSVASMVHGENVGEFPAMEALFKDMGIKDWTVDVPCITGHLKQNAPFHVPPSEAGQYLNYGFGGGLHGGGDGYACGLHLLSVLANGAVAKCAFYAGYPLGTVGEGLRKCWGRLKPVKLGALQCAGIHCPVIEACRGGCRFRASNTPEYHLREAPGPEIQIEEPQNRMDIYKCFAYGIITISGGGSQARGRPPGVSELYAGRNGLLIKGGV